MLFFFDDELKTFRNKNNGFICNVKKNKKALWRVKSIKVLRITGIKLNEEDEINLNAFQSFICKNNTSRGIIATQGRVS